MLDLIAGFSGLVSAVKGISDLSKLSQDAQEKIIQLQSIVLSLQQEAMAVADRLAELKRENDELRAKLAQQDTVVFRNGIYWRMSEDKNEEGPYCPVCYENEGKLLHLHWFHSESLPGNSVPGYWMCKHCQNVYGE